MVTNINFLLTISIICQEIRLWELVKWSTMSKYLDLLSYSLNTFFNKMYRSVWRNCMWILGLNGLMVQSTVKDVWIYDCKYHKILRPSALDFFTNYWWLKKLHLAFYRKITQDPQRFLDLWDCFFVFVYVTKKLILGLWVHYSIFHTNRTVLLL